jgi:hypothetical protein
MRSERLPVATHRNGFGSFPRFWAVDVFLVLWRWGEMRSDDQRMLAMTPL